MIKVAFFLVFLNLLNSSNLFLFQFIIIILFMLTLTLYNGRFFSNIRFNLGTDFLSFVLILLRLIIIRFIFVSIKIKININFYINSNLILCLFLVLIFSFINIFFIYICFEFRLIPLIILIFCWGYQPERLTAGLYLLFYTLFASLPLLCLLLFLYTNFYTLFFDIAYGYSNRFIIHLSLIISFLFKLPLFIAHFWLPKAHVQAPLRGSMILAGVILKIGGYGIIRFINIYEISFLKFRYL